MSLSNKSFSILKRDILLFFTNLVTGIIIARKLGPEALGVWVILQLLPAYAECFGRLKADVAAVYFLSKNKYQMGDMVFSLNLLAISGSFIIVTLILCKYDFIYHLLFSNSQIDASLFMMLIIIQIPFQFIYMNYSYLYIFKEDIRTYNGMVLIRALSYSVISIVLIFIFDLKILSVVLGTIISLVISLLYALMKFESTTREGKLLNFKLIKDLLIYGFKLYIAGVVAHLNVYITRTILVYFLVPAQVAFFSLAQNQGEFIGKIPNAMNTILLPKISKMDSQDSSAELAAKAFRVALLILLIIGLIGLISIKFLVGLLYGQSYLPLVIPFWIILPGLVLANATTVLDQYFFGVDRADILIKIAIVPLVVQVLLGIILIPLMGIVGASLSFLIALLFRSLSQILFFIKLSSCTIRKDLFIRKNDLQIIYSFVKQQLLNILYMSKLRKLAT